MIWWSDENFGVRCMISSVCYSVSDSKDIETLVVVSESTSEVDGCGHRCGDGDHGRSTRT